jgi:hypothetical protein
MISCLQKYQQSVDLQVKKIREVRSDSVKAFMMEVASEQFEAAHARRLGDKIFIWNVPRLWEKAKELTPKSVKISDLPEVDRNCWFGGRRDASISRVAAHMRRALSADLRYPIILNSDATLMDGGHRLCNAILNDNCEIAAVRFPRMPSPDAIVDVPEHLLNRT